MVNRKLLKSKNDDGEASEELPLSLPNCFSGGMR
jgi:hypothetical protein